MTRALYDSILPDRSRQYKKRTPHTAAIVIVLLTTFCQMRRIPKKASVIPTYLHGMPFHRENRFPLLRFWEKWSAIFP